MAYLCSQWYLGCANHGEGVFNSVGGT